MWCLCVKIHTQKSIMLVIIIMMIIVVFVIKRVLFIYFCVYCIVCEREKDAWSHHGALQKKRRKKWLMFLLMWAESWVVGCVDILNHFHTTLFKVSHQPPPHGRKVRPKKKTVPQKCTKLNQWIILKQIMNLLFILTRMEFDYLVFFLFYFCRE